MTEQNTRRQILKGGLALAGLGMVGVPEWVLPAMAQGEEVVPFTDLPAKIVLAPTEDRRIIDVRTIDGPLTPADQFFTTQHYGHPEVDPATYRLRVSGMVERPLELSLADLRAMGGKDLVAGFECSGNRAPLQGLCSNGRWTGVPLRTVLEKAGLKPGVREVVFFGADRGKEEVEFRAQKYELEQQYGRSLMREDALAPEPFLAWALNGAPLTRHQGAPLRLLVPGWYGAPNVKWLVDIHAQADQYLGKYQARWYRTVKGEMINGEMKWKESAITRMQLKSFIARVTSNGSKFRALGVVLHDGTPLKSVEVRVDDGPWQPATLDAATRDRYAWKLFSYEWTGMAPGDHTIVSRVTDANGTVQPTEEELETKKSFLEHNAQFVRKMRVG